MIEEEDNFPFSPRGRPPTEPLEIEAVAVLKNNVDIARVDTKNIPVADKGANTNGHITIHRPGDDRPIAQLSVQVKKLSDDKLDPPRHQTKNSTLSPPTYNNNPYLLICSDVDNNIAYWRHIDRKFLRELWEGMDPEQKSVVVYFPPENKIDGTDHEYIKQWVKIFNDKKASIEDYSEYIELKEQSDPLLGESRDNFVQIHEFLDTLNNLMSTQFSIVRQNLYPNMWKLGIAIAEYSEEKLRYGLYPIEWEENRSQIAGIEGKTLDSILDDKKVQRARLRPTNPIREDPDNHALEIAVDETQRLIDRQALDNSNIEFIHREYVFQFLDEFEDLLDIERSNEHDIEEVYKKFYKSIGEKMNDDPTLEEVYTILGRSVESKTFLTFLEYLSESKDTISRPYPIASQPLDETEEEARYVWSGYTVEAIEHIIQMYYKNIETSYSTLVSTNFSGLSEQLSLPLDDTITIIEPNITSSNEVPGGRIYELEVLGQNSALSSYHITNSDSKLAQLLREVADRPPYDDFTYRGCEYHVTSAGSGNLDDVFVHSTPVFDKIYSMLEESLSSYLEQETSSEYEWSENQQLPSEITRILSSLTKDDPVRIGLTRPASRKIDAEFVREEEKILSTIGMEMAISPEEFETLQNQIKDGEAGSISTDPSSIQILRHESAEQAASTLPDSDTVPGYAEHKTIDQGTVQQYIEGPLTLSRGFPVAQVRYVDSDGQEHLRTIGEVRSARKI